MFHQIFSNFLQRFPFPAPGVMECHVHVQTESFGSHRTLTWLTAIEYYQIIFSLQNIFVDVENLRISVYY